MLHDDDAADGDATRARAAPGDAGLTVECYGFRWPARLLDGPPVGVRGAPEKPPGGARAAGKGAVGAPTRIAAAPHA